MKRFSFFAGAFLALGVLDPGVIVPGVQEPGNHFIGIRSLGAQDLVVRRVDGTERTITASEYRSLPRVQLPAEDHGVTRTFEGVDVRAILELAEAGPVDSLRGVRLRRVLAMHGADGYVAVIALADIDVTIAARLVLVVDRTDGEVLPSTYGPLRAVVAGDGRAARWVRQLVKIEVIEIGTDGS